MADHEMDVGGVSPLAAASGDPVDGVEPAVPLRILHTEYSSVVTPIVAFIDEARGQR
jgi:hypothetical protein